MLTTSNIARYGGERNERNNAPIDGYDGPSKSYQDNDRVSQSRGYLDNDRSSQSRGYHDNDRGSQSRGYQDNDRGSQSRGYDDRFGGQSRNYVDNDRVAGRQKDIPLQRDLPSNSRYSEPDAYVSNRLSGDRGGSAMDSSSTELDHLATFTINPRQGILNPEDGIQKLRQMEETTGIWTMRVDMIVESKHLVVYEKTSQDEIERFPLAQISDVTAVTNRQRRGVYDNILLFTLYEDSSKREALEMHIFQCLSKPAQSVVDEIHAAQQKKFQDVSRQPSLEQNKPRVTDKIREYEAAAEVSAKATAAYKPSARREVHNSKWPENDLIPPADNDRIPPIDNIPVYSAERTDNFIMLLNKCFDDIEKYVARLQMAADAYRELEQRRNTRNKGGRSAMGDGMLTMRSRPPPAKEYIDVLQKFKLAFNLLAKLKGHIHDPNAPELVHFLFTPLSLVVESSRDSVRGTIQIPEKVISPLLTADALDLLHGCMTSKERDLLKSLGEPWNVSKEEWRGYVPPYFPRFYDGFQPPPAWFDETSGGLFADSSTDNKVPRNNPPRQSIPYSEENGRIDRRNERPQQLQQQQQQQQQQYDRGGPLSQNQQQKVLQQQQQALAREFKGAAPQPAPKPNVASPVTVQPALSPWEEEQAVFERRLTQQNMTIAQAISPRDSKAAQELSVKKGEIFEVIDKSRNWWKLRNSRGETGHAPNTILQLIAENAVPVRREPTRATSWVESSNNRPSLQNSDYTSNQAHLSSSPPPAMQQARHSIANDPRVNSDPRASSDSFDDDQRCEHSYQGMEMKQLFQLTSELENQIRTGPMPSRVPSVKRAVSNATNINITQYSSQREVIQWLQYKGFSDRTCQKLLGLTGDELFRYSRIQLESILGREEGDKLDSQLKVQKGLCGYEEQQSQELDVILQARRKRTSQEQPAN